MVEPGSRPWESRQWRWIAAGLALAGPSGCAWVPQSRLEECHQYSQTLQAENDRLKDSTLSLRSQNRNLNQRAVEDARRLRVQEDEVERLSQSVTAYQQDRDQLAAAYERLKGEIRSTATASTSVSGSSRPPSEVATAPSAGAGPIGGP